MPRGTYSLASPTGDIAYVPLFVPRVVGSQLYQQHTHTRALIGKEALPRPSCCWVAARSPESSRSFTHMSQNQEHLRGQAYSASQVPVEGALMYAQLAPCISADGAVERVRTQRMSYQPILWSLQDCDSDSSEPAICLCNPLITSRPAPGAF